MGFLTPGYAVFIGLLVLLYGVLVGGTWVRRVPGKTWDTVQPIIFIVIAAVAPLASTASKPAIQAPLVT